MLLADIETIEQTSQDHMDEVVRRILLPDIGGGKPPDIWDKEYGGDKPDDSGDNKKESLQYLIAWGCLLSIWAAAIFKIVSANSVPQIQMIDDAPPAAIKAYNQNRPQLDLLLSNLNPPHSVIKTSPLQSCRAP